jgi:Pyruvate/2-oxoacid:ferredoxin oxidoreductase gamma subunit
MNLPAYERFAKDVRPGGWLIVDASVPIVEKPVGVQFVSFPAIQFATERGMPRSANAVMLAVLAASGATGLDRRVMEQALAASFQKKPSLIPQNLAIFAAAYQQACG